MISDVLCDAHDECLKYLNEFKSTYSIKNLGEAKRQKLVNCLEVMRQTRIMLDTTRDDWQEQIKLHRDQSSGFAGRWMNPRSVRRQ